MNIKKAFTSRRMKYGSTAIAFTAAFVVAVVLLNWLVTELNSAGALSVDLTAEKLYEISDTTKTLLAENDKKITIYFLREEDQFDDYGKQIIFCAQKFASQFGFIDIQYIDLLKNPLFKTKYVKGTETISSYSVIVESQDGNFKILTDSQNRTESDFFVTETSASSSSYYSTYTVTGFKGERAFTSAILSVLNPNTQTAYFTTGHSETVPAELQTLLTDCGYTVEKIDLSTQTLPDKASLMIVYNPQSDFQGKNVTDSSAESSALSEIEKLVKFMNTAGNNMMVFIGPTTPELKEFEEFLSVYGVSVMRTPVMDEQNSISSVQYYLGLITNFDKINTDSPAAALTEGLNLSRKTVVPYAAPIMPLFTEKGAVLVSPVLTTSAQAVFQNGDNTLQGTTPVMTLSTNLTSADTYANLLLCSSVNYTNSAYLGSSTYGNRDLIYNCLKLFGQKNVPTNIEEKMYENNSLDMSTNQTKMWGWIVMAVPALIVLAFGTVIWLRRRHL